MPALEQVRQRRPCDLLVRVVAGDQRDGAAVAVPQPGDDQGQDAGQLGADQEQPFLVALGGQYLQQGDDLAGLRQAVGDDGELGDL